MIFRGLKLLFPRQDHHGLAINIVVDLYHSCSSFVSCEISLNVICFKPINSSSGLEVFHFIPKERKCA